MSSILILIDTITGIPIIKKKTITILNTTIGTVSNAITNPMETIVRNTLILHLQNTFIH